MRRYPSKIGIGLIVFILSVLLGTSILMVNAKEWIGLGINFLILALVAYTFKSTHYIIDHEVLKIRCGFFFNKTIAIDTIYKISESHNPISAPATSLDRLEIFYNQKESVLISPRDKKKFIAHLLQLNHKIEITTR